GMGPINKGSDDFRLAHDVTLECAVIAFVEHIRFEARVEDIHQHIRAGPMNACDEDGERLALVRRELLLERFELQKCFNPQTAGDLGWRNCNLRSHWCSSPKRHKFYDDPVASFDQRPKKDIQK